MAALPGVGLEDSKFGNDLSAWERDHSKASRSTVTHSVTLLINCHTFTLSKNFSILSVRPDLNFEFFSFRKVSSVKLEGREFQSLTPVKAKLIPNIVQFFWHFLAVEDLT